MLWVLNKNHLIETILLSTRNLQYVIKIQTKGHYVTLIVD